MKLRTRLFAWLCAASVASGAAGVVAYRLSATDHADLPNRALVRKLSRRLSRADDVSRKAVLAEATETAGIAFEFVNAPDLPKRVEFRPTTTKEDRFSWRRIFSSGPERQGPILLPGDGYGYVPILRPRDERAEDPFEDAILLGALRFPEGERFGLGPFPAMVSFGAVLLVFAQLLSRKIASPLERIGEAAARFGSGDLSARSGLAAPEAGSAETAALAGAFDRMAERIAREVREGRELLGAVSHELRSPLGRAKVAVAVAREQLGPPSAPRHGADGPLASAEKELVRVDAILGDLLASARMGLSDLRREPTAFVAFVRERIADEEMPPIVELDAPEADVTLALDRPLVGRALHNLLENARRHAPSCDVIEVVVTIAEDAVTLAVRDRGNGFAEALLPKLFTPFVRGDDARNPTQGSGLGLALVRRIAEAHGGSAHAENRDGGGAIVALRFPRRDANLLS